MPLLLKTLAEQASSLVTLHVVVVGGGGVGVGRAAEVGSARVGGGLGGGLCGSGLVGGGGLGEGGLGRLMGCDAFWRRLAEIVSASPEAQSPELVPVVLSYLEAMCAHAAGGGGEGVGEVCWQLGCLLALVFDAIPLATHTAAPLALAAQRAQALSTALAPVLDTAPTIGAHHSAARSEDDGYREAAAMLLWRAGVALERGCAELLEPGAWGLMRPTEPPAALVAARDALHRQSDAHGGGSAEGKGGRRGGGKGGARGGSASYADAAVQLAAADAVAYAAEWFHLDRVVMSTAGLFTPWGSSSPSSAPAEDDEDDPQGAAPAERAATVKGHKGPTQAGRKRRCGGRKGSSSAEGAVAGAHEGAVAGAHDGAEQLARRAAKRQKGVVLGAHESAKRQKGVVVGAHESAKRQKVVRRWLKEDVALLATWSPAEAKLAATWTAPSTAPSTAEAKLAATWTAAPAAAAVAPGCAAPLRAFASRWALACEHAPLLDAYASASDLRRWLSVLWTAVCASEGAVASAADLEASAAGAVAGAAGMAGSGARAQYGASDGAQYGAPQSVRAVSWRVLQAASTYELPRVRAALLPSAWRWLRRHLPAEESVRSRHVRAQLRFVLDGAAAEAGGVVGGEAGGEAGGESWSRLLGKRGAECLAISSEQWRSIGQLVAILSRLPLEWVPLEQVH